MPQRQLVPAPPATPPRYGLLVAAALVGDGLDWQPGIKWEPEDCSPGHATIADCADLDREISPTTPGEQHSNPFYVWASEACSALAARGRDWHGRVGRALAASQSHQVAHELWTGDLTKAQYPDGDPNVEAQRSGFLADDLTTVVSGAPRAPEAALSAVEGTASLCAEGRRLMLFMPTWLIEPVMSNSSYLRVEGNLLVTALGNVVVADSGFPGTKPDSASASSNSWIYAAPLVQVYLDQVQTLPANLEDASLVELVSWAQNNASVIAQRLALYQLDPCCRYAVETNVPVLTLP